MSTSGMHVFVAVCKQTPSEKSTEKEHERSNEESCGLITYNSAYRNHPEHIYW